jgi:GNAT superfamily N-acetyltransferase
VSGSIAPVPAGHVAAVVTYLEMTTRPELPPLPDSQLGLQRWDEIDPVRYRELFRRVGGRWLWFSRLAMNDVALLASVGEVHSVIAPSGEEAGMLELDFRTPGECLIRFLGLAPELAGQGHGRWLFAQAMRLCWRGGVERVRVNTCTLDHPAALPSYLREGFRARSRAFESFPDPRLNGLLPSDVAPQIPLLP